MIQQQQPHQPQPQRPTQPILMSSNISSSSSSKQTSSTDSYKQMIRQIKKYPEPLELRNRLIGVAFILLQAGLMVVYGIMGTYYREARPNSMTHYGVISTVLTGLFAIVGFGLVLSVYKWGNWLGLATAMFVFALSAQLCPFLQVIGYSLFLRSYAQPNFIYIYENSTTNISQFLDHYTMGSNFNIKLSSYLYQLTFQSCISAMTLMVALVGRLTMEQLFKTILLFQIFWNLCYFVIAFLAIVRNGAVSLPYVFDAYGSSYVYLFAAFFGIFFTCLTNKHILPSDHTRNILNGYSWLFSSIGTALLFSCFIFTSTPLLTHNTLASNLRSLTLFFALCGSVIGTYSGSMLANRGRMGYKEALVGTISGGVTIGSAAPYISNIGIGVMVGAVGGFISGILMRPIHRRINRNYMYDVLGLFVPFLICALLGSLVVPCAVLAWNYNQGIENQAIEQGNSNGSWVGYDKSEIVYQLVYAGVSAGIGLAGGALSGLACRWGSDTFGLAANARIFINNFGLYSPPPPPPPPQQPLQQKRKQINGSMGAIAVAQND